MGDLGVPISLANDGLPRWIPALIRNRIRLGDAGVIASMLTLCSLYRVVSYKGSKIKDTITAPGKEFDLKPYQDFIPVFTSYLAISIARYCKSALIPNTLVAKDLPERIREFDLHEDHATLSEIPRQPFKVKSVEPKMIFKSGPGSAPLPVELEMGALLEKEARRSEIKLNSVVNDIVAKADPKTGPLIKSAPLVPPKGDFYFREVLNLGNSTSALLLQAGSYLRPEHKDLLEAYKSVSSFFEGGGRFATILGRIGANVNKVAIFNRYMPKHLGKLGFKQEPAGKVRVFAMVTW
jgi:hypothetical protein